MPDLYRIRDWEEHFENNRTRELKRMPWVPIPTDLSNDSYIELIEHKNGAAHFGVWIACVEVAANSHPRGTLMRNGGIPHDSFSLSRRTRIPQVLIERALERLKAIGWVEVEHVDCGNLAGISQEGAGSLPLENIREQNKTEQNRTTPPPRARKNSADMVVKRLCRFWNEQCAKPHGLPPVRVERLSPERRQRIRAFLAQCGSDADAKRIAATALQIAAEHYERLDGGPYGIWSAIRPLNRSHWIGLAEARLGDADG